MSTGTCENKLIFNLFTYISQLLGYIILCTEIYRDQAGMFTCSAILCPDIFKRNQSEESITLYNY